MDPSFHLKMARRRTGQRSPPAACFKANGGPEGAAGLILTRVAGSVPRGAGFRLGLELFLVCTTFLCGACHASRPALCPLRSQLAVAGRAMRLRGGRGWQKQTKSGGGQQPRLAAADNAEGDGGGSGGHAQSATAGQRAGRVKLGYSAQDFDRAALVQQITDQVQGTVRKQINKESREDEEAKRKARNKNKKRLKKKQGVLLPSTKNRMRSIERTLQRKGELIPEEVKRQMNDKLEELRREQEESALVEKEKLMATRYRKIKFFERQKLQRSLSHNSRALEQAASQSEREQLQTERRQLLQDLQYVLYYPRDLKYKSVLKNPRHVIDEWRAQPDFDKKVERARQVVLAYRAMKLKQQQQQQQPVRSSSTRDGLADSEAGSNEGDESKDEMEIERRGTEGQEESEISQRKHPSIVSRKRRASTSVPDGSDTASESNDRHTQEEQTDSDHEAIAKGAKRKKHLISSRSGKDDEQGRLRPVHSRLQDMGGESLEESQEDEEEAEMEPNMIKAMRAEQKKNMMQLMDSDIKVHTHENGPGRGAPSNECDETESMEEEEEEDANAVNGSMMSSDVQIFDRDALRPSKNPLDRVFARADAPDSLDESVADQNVQGEDEIASGKTKKKGTGIMPELRVFAGSEEESETEKRRKALSHARENCLGPGDLYSDSDTPDQNPDAGGEERKQRREGYSLQEPAKKGQSQRASGASGGGSKGRRVPPHGQSSYNSMTHGQDEDQDDSTAHEDTGFGEELDVLHERFSSPKKFSQSVLDSRDSAPDRDGPSWTSKDGAETAQQAKRGLFEQDIEMMPDHTMGGMSHTSLSAPETEVSRKSRHIVNTPPQKQMVENTEEEDKCFMDMTPSVLQQKPWTQGDRSESREEDMAAPVERTRIGLWAGGKSEQWWNPTDIQTGTESTQFMKGLEKIRQEKYKEIRAYNARLAADAGNMTAGDRHAFKEQTFKQLQEIERASQVEMQTTNDGAWHDPDNPEFDFEDEDEHAAELKQTVEKMCSAKPAKIYEDLSEGLVGLCSAYIADHGTDEQKQDLFHGSAENQPSCHAVRADEPDENDSGGCSVDFEDENEGITLFKATPSKQKKSEAKSASASLSRSQTPAWKKLGRAKQEMRSMNRQSRAELPDVMTSPHLDALAKTPTSSHPDLSYVQPAKAQGRTQMDLQMREHGVVEATRSPVQSALEREGNGQVAAEASGHATTPSALPLGDRHGWKTAAWKRVGRTKKDLRAKRRIGAALQAEDVLEGVSAMLKTPAQAQLPVPLPSAASEAVSSPCEQLRQMSVGAVAEKEEEDTLQLNPSPRADNAPAVQFTENEGKPAKGGGRRNSIGNRERPATPTRVREVMSKIDSFLVQRKGQRKFQSASVDLAPVRGGATPTTSSAAQADKELLVASGAATPRGHNDFRKQAAIRGLPGTSIIVATAAQRSLRNARPARVTPRTPGRTPGRVKLTPGRVKV